LKKLVLVDTKITDRGIAITMKLTELEWLNVAETAVTDGQLRKNKRILPKLQTDRDNAALWK
jgi:hypothetical protein